MTITREEVEAVALLLANDQEGTFDLIISTDADQLWMIICGALVFFMHAGFAMLEAGSIHETSVANIMFKNISTVSIGVLAYWFLGFGLAFPEDNDEDTATILARKGDFVGKASDKAFWFFQMVFAATAATIVSGAVAGRIKLTAYFVIASFLSGIVFPFVTHWIFDVGGYLSGFTQKDQLFNFAEDNVPCGTIDFAGSGVVHLTGGVAAFWGALILGPREKWKPDKNELPAHNFALATLGTFILWFGWFGFNCGSSLVWDGFIAGHVAVVTVLSPAASCIVGMLIGKFYLKEWNIGLALNSILAGLVAITAGAATTRPGFAILVGILAGFVYFGASRLNRFIFKIDDPVDAVAVHGACGLFGLIMAGIVADDRLVQVIYSQDDIDCNTAIPALLTYQVIAAITIFAWVSLWGIAIFGGLALTGQLKLNSNEQYNVDEAEHGGGAYNLD